jgi:hypothetical protein
LPEFDAGSVKATMTADHSGVHSSVDRTKKDFRDLAQAITEAMRTVKKEENEATKAERERQAEMRRAAEEARKAAQIEKQAAQERKDAYRDLSIQAGISFAAITAAIWKATQENNKLKASFTGLDSIATGTVGSYEKIKVELQKVQEDGMIPLTNATAAYKNLLSRYKDEDTAIQMFHRIADAAAFGRQGHLSLGEAIQGTTEGLRNEMSQMVDNGGITKNLSVMHKEYAATIGKTYGQLTEAEKHQAEINGIMRESTHQVGDLAKLQSQLSGEMSKANATTTMTAAAFGGALEPAVSRVVTGYTEMMKNIKGIIEAQPGMTAGIATGALAMSGLVSVSSAWIALDMGKKIAAGLGALTSPVGLAAIAISTLTAVVIGLNTHMKARVEKQREHVEKTEQEAKSLGDLITKYEKLNEKTGKDNRDKETLIELSNKIAAISPELVRGYDAEGNAILDLTGKQDALNKKMQEALELRNKLNREGLNALRTEILKLEQQKDSLTRQQNMQLYGGKTSTKDQDKYLRQQLALQGIYGAEADRQVMLTRANYSASVREISDLISQKRTEMEDMRRRANDVNGTAPEVKPTTVNGEPTGDLSAEAKKRAQEQADLVNQLQIEQLERQRQFQEAEIAQENIRYQEERKLAKGNATLLEEIEIGHNERLQAIDEKYKNIRQDAVDQEMDYLYENDQIGLQDYIEYLNNRLQWYEEYSAEWLAITNKMKELEEVGWEDNKDNPKDKGIDLNEEFKDATEDGLMAFITLLAEGEKGAERFGDAIHDILQQLGKMIIQEKLLRPFVNQLFGGSGSSGLSSLPGGNIGLMEFHSGGVVGSSLPRFHSGGPITDIMEPVRAHTGMLIGDLAPDERPIIAQTGERVLSREENKDYEAGRMSKINSQTTVINQSSQPVQAQSQVDYDTVGNLTTTIILKDLDMGGPISRRLKGGR